MVDVESTSVRGSLARPAIVLRCRLGVLLSAFAALVLIVLPVEAQASTLFWSTPMALDEDGGAPLMQVACPSASQCTAGDLYGRVVTFNPSTPGASTPDTIDSGNALYGIACPSVSQCTVVDAVGQEVTFNPSSPEDAPAPVAIDPLVQLDSVACPSTTQCTTVDWDGQEVTFDPLSPTAPAPTTLDSGRALTALSCPASTQCTAVDNAGSEVLFNPVSPNASTRTRIDAARNITALACASANQCVAIDADGYEVTFDPTSGSGSTPVEMNAGQTVRGVACLSTSSCVSVDVAGDVAVFDPGSPGSATSSVADAQYGFSGLACFSATQCVGVDWYGNEVTFDAASPGSGTSASVDTGNVMTATSCPVDGECVAVDTSGQAVTYDSSWTPLSKPVSIDSDSNNVITAISCPSATQCTAVDENGAETTFDPEDLAHSAEQSQLGSGQSLSAISCSVTGASSSQCTAVGAGGYEVTFALDSSGDLSGTPTVVQIDPTSTLNAVACSTSPEQCVAVDSAGNEITFDPDSASDPSVTRIVTGCGNTGSCNLLTGVACPSASQCTAVDVAGYAITFDQGTDAVAAADAIDSGEGLTAIACPSTSECLTTDYEGEVIQGDPTQSTWAVQSIADASGVNGVACEPQTDGSDAGCLVVDSVGQGFTAAEKSNATVPEPDGTPPQIYGTSADGQVLSEIHGQWSNTPTSYAYQWERCNSSGSDCQTIGGADGPTYTLTDSDVGHTIVVVEIASNAGGASGTLWPSSSSTVVLPPLPPSDVSLPLISGQDFQGQVLTEANGFWTRNPTSFANQWEDCDSTGNNCEPIAGATGQTYTLTAGDVGDTIEVQETATNIGGTGTAVSSLATGVIGSALPVDATPPTISGTPAPGQELSVVHGSWSGDPTGYTYQWEDCNSSGGACATDRGATGQSYMLASDDLGHTIRVSELASNAFGPSPSAALSAPTQIVSALGGVSGKPVAGAPPAITGQDSVGQTLNGSAGAWSGSPSFSYQWQRCAPGCADIAGATQSRYTLTDADAGAKLLLVVTATDAAGSTQADSSQVGPVAAPSGGGAGSGDGGTGGSQGGTGGSGANGGGDGDGNHTGHGRAASTSFSKQALLGLLAVSGKRATIPAVLRSGYTVSVAAPGSGRLVVAWFASVKGKQVVVASAGASFTKAGRSALKIALTRAGRTLLRKSHRLKLMAKATSSAPGGSVSSASRWIVLS